MARPVITSSGERYASMTEAARAHNCRVSDLWTAVQHTHFGLYRTKAGRQWAYSEDISDAFMWPEKSLGKRKPVICSDGRRFESVSAAAQGCGVNAGNMYSALAATDIGKYRERNGLQFAYVATQSDPDFVWPVKSGRVVVTSDGREFRSRSEAAAKLRIGYERLARVINHTLSGHVAFIGGVQVTTKEDFDRPDFNWPHA